VSTALPTGSDSKSIGSSHAVEIEPFVHAAYMRGGLELVGFGRYSTLTRLHANETNERELTIDASLLTHVLPRAQLLLEVESSRTLAGAEQGRQITSIAPGVEIVRLERVMVGASYALSVGGDARNSRQALVSVFYHF
jgi:hypothetical protein